MAKDAPTRGTGRMGSSASAVGPFIGFFRVHRALGPQ